MVPRLAGYLHLTRSPGKHNSCHLAARSDRGLTKSGALPILAADLGAGDGGASGGPAVDELFERGRNWLSGVLIVAALGAAVGLAYPLLQRPAAPPVQLVATPPPAASPASEVQVHIGGAVEQPG